MRDDGRNVAEKMKLEQKATSNLPIKLGGLNGCKKVSSDTPQCAIVCAMEGSVTQADLK